MTRGLPRAFWLLLAGLLVNKLGGFVAPFLAIYLVSVRGLRVERAGTIVALIGLASIASGPVGGVLADRVGRRMALAIATALGGGAMLALGLATTPTAIAIAAAFTGFCSELYRPAVAAIVADVIDERDRPRAYGLIHWVVNIGFSVSVIAAGLLARRSFTVLFVGDALTTFLFGAVIWAGLPETRPRSAPHERQPLRRLLRPYGDRTFLVFAVLALVVATIFRQGDVTLPLDMRVHGMSPERYGMLMAINGVLIVFLQPFVGSFVRRLPRGRALAIAALLTGFGFGMCGLPRASTWLYAASIVVWTLGEIAIAPIGPTVIAEMAPEDLRGSYQGAYQITWGGAAFLAPALGAYVLGGFGSQALWASCAAAGIVAAVGFRLLFRGG